MGLRLRWPRRGIAGQNAAGTPLGSLPTLRETRKAKAYHAIVGHRCRRARDHDRAHRPSCKRDSEATFLCRLTLDLEALSLDVEALSLDPSTVETAMLRPRTLLALLLLSMSLLGCGPSLDIERDPNGASGPDGQRLGAIQVPTNRTVIDHVDLSAGDMTDWKYFDLPTRSFVELVIAFDTVEAAGTVIIRDAMGMQLARVDCSGEPKLQTAFRADGGLYYVEVFVEEGGSSYTLEINTEPAI